MPEYNVTLRFKLISSIILICFLVELLCCLLCQLVFILLFMLEPKLTIICTIDS